MIDVRRTLHARPGDGLRRALLGVAAALLGGGTAWFFLAEITIHAVSSDVRLEAPGARRPVDAQVAGRLMVSHMVLGREVRSGEVLAELDSAGERRRLEQERATLVALGPRIEALQREIQALEAEEVTTVGAFADSGPLADLRDQLAEIMGREARTRANVAVLEQDIERRRIRSPVSGRIAEVEAASGGALLQPGARLGAVEPSGALHIVAEYSVAPVLGRIRPGQPARLRLHGSPATEHGAMQAEVRRVTGELGDGQMRVELRLVTPAPLSLASGLFATLEIEVARVSPAELVMHRAW